jgi:WD40 repeat protein
VLSDHKNGVNEIDFSPNGRLLATGSFDNTAMIWSTIAGARVRALPPHSGSISALRFSARGDVLATGSSDGRARTWTAATGTMTNDFFGYEGGVSTVAFSPDGTVLLVAGGNLDPNLWRQDGREPARLSLEGHSTTGGGSRESAEVNDGAFSPDGTLVATASDDHTARIWNAADGTVRHTLRHDYRVLDVEFSPDGTRVVTASADDSARVWRTEDGALLHRLSHADDVERAFFTPDGSRVLTASRDRTIGVWSTADGTMLDRLVVSDDYVVDAAVSPDGRRLATASAEGAVWSLGMEDLLARARRLSSSHIQEDTFEPTERSWLAGEPWVELTRARSTPWAGRLATESVLHFRDRLGPALVEARESGRLVLVVFSRYRPP